jgi:hypothetical protein
VIAQELVRRQRDLEPKDDLDAHAGQWVILRDGHVIAHAQELGQLVTNGQLGDGDAVLHVTDDPGDFAA